MVTKHPRKVNTFLNLKNNHMQFIVEKIKLLRNYNQKIIKYLPEHIAKYCQITNCTSQSVTITTANGSIATFIRYQTNELIEKFQTDSVFHTIRHIHCKVQALPHTLLHKPHSLKQASHMPALSSETAEIIANVAESISHSSLKNTMTRIASRRKQEKMGEGE